MRNVIEKGRYRMKKMKLITLMLVMIMALGVFAGCADSGEPAVGESGKVILKVGTEPTYPPFEYTDEANKIIGFDIDLADALAEKMNMEVEIIPTTFDGIFNGMNAGTYDVVIAAVSMTPKRMETMLFSKPYLSNGQVILTNKGDKNISTQAELSGMNVGVQLGTTADTAAEKAASEFGFEVTKFDEILQTFSAMKAGHVDAIAVDYAVAIEYVQKDPESYQISEVMLTNEPIAVAIKKDNVELQEKINAAMEEIRADGTLKSISEKWLGGDYTSNIDEELEVVE